MAYACREPSAAEIGQLVDDGRGNFKGECVSLVKRLCPALPQTKLWRRGAQISTSTSIAAGTAIATFTPAGTYAGHAAVYVSRDARGITAWDQYNHPPKPTGKRVIVFDDARSAVNNANAYYVIE